ncbi:MAG: 2-iminobutanoate/2-iminopropanoate deaminase [Rhodospirillaceae bacterium]|jgi:2-iminobutanoate/2-iminopropanoate deaminase|nr:2-iminobutanoate/2-iminopropanoate deaminase [Rhodospirillaceae bacterium]
MSQSKKRQEIRQSGLSEPLSHYTDAVRFGDLLFISGIAPLDSAGSVVAPDDPVKQTECIFESMKKILDTAGASFADVLRVTVYLTDVADRTKINPVRKRYFGETKPASTLIGVNALALPGMKVEIEAVVGMP